MFVAIVGRLDIVAVTSLAGLPPADGGSMLSAVGSLDLGQPSSTRMSFGERTPVCRARCHDAQWASGSAHSKSPRSMRAGIASTTPVGVQRLQPQRTKATPGASRPLYGDGGLSHCLRCFLQSAGNGFLEGSEDLADPVVRAGPIDGETEGDRHFRHDHLAR